MKISFVERHLTCTVSDMLPCRVTTRLKVPMFSITAAVAERRRHLDSFVLSMIGEKKIFMSSFPWPWIFYWDKFVNYQKMKKPHSGFEAELHILFREYP